MVAKSSTMKPKPGSLLLPGVRTIMTMKIHRPIGTVDAKHISVMHCGCANSNVVCLCANYEQSEHLAS